MATRPSFLSASYPTVKIDGTDLHDFGVIVTEVVNPVPSATQSNVSIPGRHGDFDFANRYEPRYMTLGGNIVSTTHSVLMSNIDELKSWLRLRENGDSMQVIFQNQTSRYWTCRYEGEFEITPLGLPNYSTSARFVLRLKCLKPYAEATTITTATIKTNIYKTQEITYSGTIPAPLTIEALGLSSENLFEKAVGDASDDSLLWGYNNSSGSEDTDTSHLLYGSACVVATRTDPGAFLAYATIEVDGTFEILDKSKYYVFGAYCNSVDTSANNIRVNIQGGDDKSADFPAQNGNWVGAFVKVSPTDLSPATALLFMVEDDGTNADFWIDGVFCYEITAAEYADSSYVPPPYVSDPGGDDIVPLKDPAFQLHRSINLFPKANGDTSVGTVVSDPLGGNDNAYAQVASWNSPTAYVQAGKVYRFSCRYYCPRASGSCYLSAYFLNESGAVIAEYNLALAGTDTSWQDFQKEGTCPVGACLAKFYLYKDTALLAYLKDFMIVEDTALAQGYDTYKAPNYVEMAYTGTVDTGDRLIVDSAKLAAQFIDVSVPSASNAASAISGQRLLLVPGANNLRMGDARLDSASPEEDSCGMASVTYSYRARYI